jgi:hypothetical protein
VAAHAVPLGIATTEGWMVGVQLDVETRQAKDPKGQLVTSPFIWSGQSRSISVKSRGVV